MKKLSKPNYSSTSPLKETAKTEMTEDNINKKKPSTISVLGLSERSASKMEKKIVVININKKYWKRMTYQA